MPADAPRRTTRRLSPREQAAVAALGSMIVIVCLWLWAVTAAPPHAKELMMTVGGLCAVLLAGAAAAITHLAATARRMRERARLAEGRFALLEREALRIAEDSLPTLGRQVREGVPAAKALARLPRPQEHSLRRLVSVAAYELEALERERAAARSARAATEEDIARVARTTLPDLAERIQVKRMAVDAALAGIRQPGPGPLRDLVRETARHLGTGERRSAAVMTACAGAAARVQAQATSLLAHLRELEDRYGDRDDVSADLLDLDHRVSQLSRLADNIALLSGGRSGRRWTRPIPMESVLRGAMGRIGDYRRIRLRSVGTAAVAGHAAEGVMHALAELMDNATSFSPQNSEVHVYVEEEDAGVVVTVEDAGPGMRPRQRRRAAKLVSDPVDLRSVPSTRLGLAVVGRLAGKYGLRVSFRPSARGGTEAVLVIPRVLITRPAVPPAELADTTTIDAVTAGTRPPGDGTAGSPDTSAEPVKDGKAPDTPDERTGDGRPRTAAGSPPAREPGERPRPPAAVIPEQHGPVDEPGAPPPRGRRTPSPPPAAAQGTRRDAAAGVAALHRTGGSRAADGA